MKTTLALAVVVALATSSIACSSPAEKEDVDTGTALSALRSPTGSFSEQTAAKAFGGYRGQKANASKVSAPKPGSSSGTSGTQSIRLLDRAASSEACGQGQSCACPNGGAMSYTGESTAEGSLVKVTFDACVFEDGFGFDGKAVLLASTKSLLGISSEGSASGSSDDDDGAPAAAGSYAALLLAAKGTATQGSQKLPLEFALLTEDRYAFLAVTVPDGSIVIGVSDDGRAIVKSKEGTWTCQSTAGKWSCKSDHGESLTVAEEAVSSASDDTSPSDEEGSSEGSSKDDAGS